MGRWVGKVLAYSLIPSGLAALAFLVTPGVLADDPGGSQARGVAEARALDLPGRAPNPINPGR